MTERNFHMLDLLMTSVQLVEMSGTVYESSLLMDSLPKDNHISQITCLFFFVKYCKLITVLDSYL